jgi:hypothetical protein
MFFSAQTTLTVDLRAWALVLAAVLFAVGLLAYWRTTPTLERHPRLLLTSLRIAALLCLVLFLLDPRAIRRDDREEAPRVALLVDRSESMSAPCRGLGGRRDALRRGAAERRATRARAGPARRAGGDHRVRHARARAR